MEESRLEIKHDLDYAARGFKDLRDIYNYLNSKYFSRLSEEEKSEFIEWLKEG